MIDFELTPEQQMMRDVARDFALREIAPAVDHAERVRDGHIDRDGYLQLFRSATKIGLHSMLLPVAYGGGGQSCIDNAIVQEELGAIDVGLASSLNLTMTVPNMIAVGGTDAQQRDWLPALVESDDHVLAGALNEPGVAGSELFCPLPDSALGIRTRAARDGDHYVINGSKAGWVTNGGIAKAYFVFARTSFDGPAMATTSAFYIPADTPGLSTGPRTELLGMRSSWHAELFLDDVRVAESSRLGAEHGGLALMGAASGGMAVGLAAAFVGLARAAFEVALSHADQRMSGGQPIRQHQAVALQLADAAVDLQTARLLVWDAAVAVDRGDPAAVWKVPAAKTLAVDVAIANAERAVKIHGAAGVSRGMPPEKLLRDAWTGYSCDFTKEVLRLGFASALA